jgi:AcrR family transcriptional regulator
MELNNQAELKILEAAEKIFYSKGKDGASMQEIADEAGITRTSLNYYYRSKDKLFDAVFRNAMTRFVPKLAGLMQSTDSLSEYFPRMAEIIIDTMIEHPQIPVFVLAELTSNPERVPQMISELGIHPIHAMQKMRSDERLSKLSVDPRQVIMNLLAMCIFPFAAKPILVSIMYQGDEQAYINAMEQRKKLIPKMTEAMFKNVES